jgi:P4 family phage/plasmid primase-like protien
MIDRNKLQEFFDAIWGSEPGIRFIGTKTGKGVFQNTPCDTNAEAIEAVEHAVANGWDCYHALSLFERPERKSDAAAGSRVFAIDLDVKPDDPKCYDSQKTALIALSDFTKQAELPTPLVVSSGNGLHAYYIHQAMIAEPVWLESARRLKALCRDLGLKADATVTADAARVLRTPESRNYKQGGDGEPCEILQPKVFTVDGAVFAAALNKVQPEKLPTDISLNDAFSAGIQTGFENDPIASQEIARMCVAHLSAQRADPYDDWLAVGMVLHQTFGGAPEGLTLWDEWSSKGSSYKPGVCRQKWDGFDPRDCSVGSLIFWATEDDPAFSEKWEAFKANRRMERLAAMSKEIQLTDVGNAQRLVALHGDSIRYDSARRLWYAWKGSHWAESANAVVTQLAISTVKAMYGEAAKLSDDGRRASLVKHALKSEAVSRIEAMIKLAESDPAIQCDVSDFDSHAHLLNVANGVIDLRDGALLPHSREFMLSTCIPVAYDRSAKSPIFERFLRRIFAGDSVLMEYVQRAIGYSLTAETSEHVFFLCYGEGSNGKSTLLETIQGLLGELAGTIRTEALMQHKFTSHGGHNEDIATLLGKRFASASETEAGHHFAEAALKQLTGGDTITASRKYGRAFSFNPTFKLWITANHRPNIGGMDAGIWRRVREIPFTEHIQKAERDLNLKAKLQAEYEGILAWAVEGAVRWYAEALGSCPAVERATDAYRSEQDTVANFIAECCELGAGLTAVPGMIFDDYKRYCIDNGTEPLNRNQFPKELEKRGYTKARVKQGNTDRTLWQGIQLRSGTTFGVSATIH